MNEETKGPEAPTSEKPQLREISEEKLAQILEAHRKWVESQGKQGKQADLSRANLRGANLENACLVRANLREADLSRANLRGANLENACLVRANLREADLSRSQPTGGQPRKRLPKSEPTSRRADFEGVPTSRRPTSKTPA